MKRIILLFVLLSMVLFSSFATELFDVPLTVVIQKSGNNYNVTITFEDQEDSSIFILRSEATDPSSNVSLSMTRSSGVQFTVSRPGNSKTLAIQLLYHDPVTPAGTYYYSSIYHMADWTTGTFHINTQGKIGGEPSDNLAYFTPSSNTVINLDESYNTPLMNAAINTLGLNYLGKIGSMNTTHSIMFSIASSGRFQSMSEPSLYREYWLALCPYYITRNNMNVAQGEKPYCYDTLTQTTISSTSLVPNTRDALDHSINVATPPTFSENASTVPVGPSSETAYVRNQLYTIMLCMESIDSETLKHMAEVDDYYTDITISWVCLNPDCEETSHSGSYSLNIRGFYSENSNNYLDSLSFVISPSAESLGIDLIEMALENPQNQNPKPSVKISDFRIVSYPRTVTESGETPSKMDLYRGNCVAYNWNEHVYVYISASSDLSGYNEGFLFVNKVSHNTIPFQLQVRDSNTGEVNNNITYDGTTAWNGLQGSPAPSSYCLDLGTLNITNDNRGNEYGSIDFSQSVYLVLPESSVAMLRNYKSNPSASGAGVFPGKYEATIYYHIICTD